MIADVGVSVLEVCLDRSFHSFDCLAHFCIHFESQIDHFLVLFIVPVKRAGIHGDQLGVRPLKEFSLPTEFGEGFLHRLARSHTGIIGV